jgi:methionyl-tRNA formyltransferase
MKRYVVVGRHPWNRRHYEAFLKAAPGEWLFVDSQSELDKLSPEAASFRYIFFLHWSQKVPESILNSCECVCFHMTDVPYGRGGSPLQNLIVRGHRDTMLTALRMISDFDAGPVYSKMPLSLEGGTAEEIYQRASRLSCQMALRIAAAEPEPMPQQGNPVTFKRRTPDQSRFPDNIASIEALFDHIRMLDAAGYPKAFLEHGPLRLEFTRAALYDGHLITDVQITLRTREDQQS